jgi:hypothetical protein
VKWRITITVLLVNIYAKTRQFLNGLREVVQAGFVHEIISLLCNTFGISASFQKACHGLCAAAVYGQLQRGRIVVVDNVGIGTFGQKSDQYV